MADEKKLKQLLYYTNRGWSIFPVYWMSGSGCACNQPGCKSPGKHPLIGGGFKSASINPEQIAAWHQKWPDANWGLATGQETGLLIIDIDDDKGGFETWEMIRIEHPEPIETVTTATGGGGRHLWFTYPEGAYIQSRAAVLGPGVDVRANDGYIIVPPSKTQKTYKFELNPIETELMQPPAWLVTSLNGHRGRKDERATIERLPATVDEGERNQNLVKAAGAMRRIGLREAEIEPALRSIRDQRFDPGNHPVTDDEIHKIAVWVDDKPREYHYSDLGNTERFVDLNRGDVCYVFEHDRWLVWNGKKWSYDPGEVQKRGHQAIRWMYTEAANVEDENKRKQLVQHALRSEQAARIESMIKSARPYLEVKQDQLDQHPMKINVNNGIIDLDTGSLLPHDPKYLLTKIIDIPYNPDAECPAWTSFLDLITGGDQALQLHIQLAVGYSLTARTSEHAFFFLFGSGANGKSTFTETIRRLFGDYAARIDIEALLNSYSHGQAATPYVAGLAGARFVLASEIPDNRSMNESLIKDLTGGDSLTARFLFGNPFTFAPSHHLWVFGNYKPRIKNQDEGIRRRINLIPFKITIPEDVRRPMDEVLDEFQAEMPGILAWAVTGCLLWRHNGLGRPASVIDATREYLNENDVLNMFLEERCEMHSEYSIRKDDLYKAWRNWCEDNGETEMQNKSKKWLTQRLGMRGYDQGGDGRTSLLGLRLKK